MKNGWLNCLETYRVKYETEILGAVIGPIRLFCSSVCAEPARQIVRLHARNARVQQNIPPSPYSAVPSQMTIGQRQQGGQKPECVGEVFSIKSIDSWMAKYGDSTYHRACLFPYPDGYQVAATRFSRTSARMSSIEGVAHEFQ